jgi:hypothetical protein
VTINVGLTSFGVKIEANLPTGYQLQGPAISFNVTRFIENSIPARLKRDKEFSLGNPSGATFLLPWVSQERTKAAPLLVIFSSTWQGYGL